ncbi:hypothetical protein CsSME_00042515 [Camellia sinensis var. sinensis]
MMLMFLTNYHTYWHTNIMHVVGYQLHAQEVTPVLFTRNVQCETNEGLDLEICRKSANLFANLFWKGSILLPKNVLLRVFQRIEKKTLMGRIRMLPTEAKCPPINKQT